MGWKSLREGLEANSSRDLEELRIFSEVFEPFGSDWWQTGKICETVALAAGAKRVRAHNFMPIREEQKTAEQLENAFRALGGG